MLPEKLITHRKTFISSPTETVFIIFIEHNIMSRLNLHVGGTSHLSDGIRWYCLCIISPKLWLLPGVLRESMAKCFKALKLVLK